jgi:hypothetical protein
MKHILVFVLHLLKGLDIVRLTQVTLNIYQKGAHYLGIKIFNNLPFEIKNVAGNPQKFKTALKQCL